MDVTAADVEALRAAFFKKITDSGLTENDDFHPADINRIKANDDWLRRFLAHQENNHAEALSMLWEAVQWRKSFGTNDISEENINMDLARCGSIFAHNRDKDGKALLIFKSKLHYKDKFDVEDQKRVLVYWMERLDRENKGDRITLFLDASESGWANVDMDAIRYMIDAFKTHYPRQERDDQISIYFDMSGAGLSNMDTDHTKYVINLFKFYYPDFLNNIYVFDMAWVLSAVFKLIKSWLPPKAVQKIKTLSKSNVLEYIAPDQALKNWGGQDDYQFEFVPEVRAPAAEVEKKKVHFADGSPVEENKQFSDAKSPSPVPTNKLKITPPDTIPFALENGETTSTIRLSNQDACPISYKIKTTSPEKFRVRPSAGQLQPGGSTVISVTLQPGYESTALQRDKFMIMAVSVTPDLASLEAAELWKASNVMQHRLRCSLPASANLAVENTRNGSVPDNDRQLTKLSAEVSKLHNELHSVADEIRRIQIQQWVLLLLVGLLTALTMYLVRQEPPTLPPSNDDCLRPPLP